MDKNLVFAEYFSSEQEVRRNPNITDVILGTGNISGGKWLSSLATSSTVNVKGINLPIGQDVTFRFKCRPTNVTPSSTNYFLDMRLGSSAGYIGWSTIGALLANSLFTSVTFYINGVVNGSLSGFENQWIDVVVTATTQIERISAFSVSRFNAGTTQSSIDFDSIEIYNKALTAEEVSNLYNDARYKVPSLEHGEGLSAEMTIGWDAPGFWNLTIPEMSYVNGLTVVSGTGAVAAQTFWEIGKNYSISITVEDLAGGTLRACYDGTGAGTAPLIQANGTYEYYYEPDTGTGMYLYFGAFTGVITSLSIKEVVVNPTSKILHVNSFDGVCRNLLSGDYLEAVRPTGATLFNAGTGGDAVVTYSNGLVNITQTSSPSENYRPTIKFNFSASPGITVNKKYNVFFRSRLNSGSVRLLAGIPIRVGGVIAEEDHYRDHIFTNEEYFQAVFTAGDSQLEVTVYLNGSDADAFDLDIYDFYIQEVIPEVELTDVDVVKEGSVRVPRFNGDTSKIDCGDYNDLTGDITFLGWFDIKNLGRSILQGRFFDNGRLIIRGTTPDDTAVTSNASDYSITTTAVPFNEWLHLAVTRKADGTVAIYYNGEEVGTVSSDSGTPVAGSTNMIIGNQNAGSRGLNDLMGEVIVLEGLLTPEEISRYYTSTKHLYNK